MKLSFSTLGCPSWSLEQVLDGAVAAGIDGIDFRGLGLEIDITRLPEFSDDMDATAAQIEQRGLVVSGLSTSVTLISPAPERWQMMLEECQRYARLAERLHCRHLRLFGGAIPRGLEHSEARGLAQRHLRQCIKVCRAYGCLALVETHDDWASSSAVLELLDGLPADEVGVIWDLEHPWRAGERPADTAAALRPYLRYIHCKDSTMIGDKRIHRLLGEGELPLDECLGVLREINYDGWICLESEKRWDPEAPPPEVAFSQFTQFMRQHGI